MTVWPIIVRELRAESRHPINYWIRVAGAAALLAVFIWVWSQQERFRPGSGGQLFATLNGAVFAAIWLFGPLLSADCISGERREGTLGLLFLTPLGPRDIVLAKVLTHGLRAMTLLLAVMPILVIPVLMGGVSGVQALRAFLLDTAALVLALSAGLLASSFCREWVRTMILAMSMSVVSAFLFVSIHGLSRAFQVFLTLGGPLEFGRFMQFLWPYALNRIHRMVAGDPAIGVAAVAGWRPRMTNSDLVSLLLAGGLLVLALLLALAAMFIAARRIKASWQESSPSRQVLWLLRTFCTPLFWRQFFRGEMKRKLNANPIAWLHQYSWSARLTKWGWCLLVVCIETVLVIMYDPWRMLAWQNWLAHLIFLGMAFSAVSSFRIERQTGALELLLVTPLSETDLIGGRLWGIWKQFLPAVAVLLIVSLPGWSTTDIRFSRGDARVLDGEFVYLLTQCVKYLTIPIVGLYLSMLRLHYILAGVLAFSIGTCLPWVALWGLVWLLSWDNPLHINLLAGDFWFLGLLALHLCIPLGALYLLHRNLKNRSFQFS